MNVALLLCAEYDEELMNILKAADLVIPDGIGIVWASKYSEKKLTERVAGYDFVQKLLKEIEPRQAIDSNNNLENEDCAVFFTSSFLIASAYAFKDEIKKISADLPWNFEIGGNARTGEINIVMDNINIDDDLNGYIYVVQIAGFGTKI